MKQATAVVHCTENRDTHTGAISTPIYQTATFSHPALFESTGYDYSRTLNPTREALERHLAALEDGHRAFAFSTGMAAVSAALSVFKSGEKVLVSEDLYGGSYRLFEAILRPLGVEAVYVDLTDLSSAREAYTAGVKGIWLESPTNPLMKVADIVGLAALSHEHQGLLLVDNTFLSPYFQQPLKLGADLVVHSGTKYLGGHNDTLSGFVVTKTEQLSEQIYFVQNTIGAVLSPFDSWLTLRGIKTLALRMEKSQENALAVAHWLRQQPQVSQVIYPGLKDHSGHEIMKKQASGFGAMISFHVKDSASVSLLLSKLSIIQFAESLGGVESLITYPLTQTHQAIPEPLRTKLGITDTLLRLSIGIEDSTDLIEDLKSAL